MSKFPETEDDLSDAIMEAQRDAMRERAREDDREADRRIPADMAIAWRLFEHIAGRDPQSTGDKDSALATFKECLDTVRYRRSPWSWTQKDGEPGSLSDEVPF